MTFVDFCICHRLASKAELFSVTLTFIFDFKCLKYVKLVCFRILPDNKIMKRNHHYTYEHLQSNGISPIFLHRELDLHYRFQMFKICAIHSFSHVAG